MTKDGQRLLANPSPEAFREGIEALAFDDKFDELHRINNIRGQSGKARRWMTEPSERRGEILEGLAEWPVKLKNESLVVESPVVESPVVE